ncbi:VOC family protein [Nocardiopsis coralliicola]
MRIHGAAAALARVRSPGRPRAVLARGLPVEHTRSMLEIGLVVLGVDDAARAAAFWTAALDYVPQDDDAPGDWVVLAPRSGRGAHLALDRIDTPAPAHPRMHLDLNTASPAEQAAEVERLVALGAERVDWEFYPEDPDFVVLADTEGNRFCVVDTSHP